MPDTAHTTILIAAASKSTAPSSSSNIVFILVLIVIFYFIYRFFMRPRQRAAQAQRDTLMTLEPGDEVLTGAGIFGTVQHIQDDRVTLWTGTGSTITVLRRTIARKLDEHETEEGAENHDPEHHDTWDDDDSAELDRAHNEHVEEAGSGDHPALGLVADGQPAGQAEPAEQTEQTETTAPIQNGSMDPTGASGTTTGTTDAPELDGHSGDASTSESHTGDEER
jgi:preprotein translocase subunit YajC